MQTIILCRIIEYHIFRQGSSVPLVHSDDAYRVSASPEILTGSKPKAWQLACRIKYGKGQNIRAGWEIKFKISGYFIGFWRCCPVRDSIHPVYVGVILGRFAGWRPCRGSPSLTRHPSTNVCPVKSVLPHHTSIISLRRD
jgi:hypothetical protein